MMSHHYHGSIMATADDVVDALVRACRGARIYRNLPPGVRRTHLYVLKAVEELGGAARVTEIAKQSLVKVPNMTRLLKETDAAGWTAKSEDPRDQRAVIVRLTEEGSACLDEYYWNYYRSVAEQLQAESDAEYDVMIAAIDRAVSAIERATAEVDEADAGRG